MFSVMLKTDGTLLEGAVVGYRAELERVAVAIAAIQRRFGGQAVIMSAIGPVPKRKMCAAARKRIPEAQKKRWAEYRQENGQQ